MNYEFYKKLVDHAIWGVIYCESQYDTKNKKQIYKITKVNPAFCEMITKSATEVIGQDILTVFNLFDFNVSNLDDFFLEKKSEKLYSKIYKNYYEVSAFSFEKGGYAFMVMPLSSDNKKSNNPPKHLQKKETFEFELKYKFEELEKLFEILPGLLCVVDKEQHIYLKMNHEWEKFLGFSYKDIENKSIISFIHPEDVQDSIDAVGSLKPNDYLYNFVNRFINSEGHYRYIQWNCFYDGELMYCVANDISKMKEYETEIISQKKFLKTLVDNIPDYVFYKDNKGAYLGCNKAMMEIVFPTNEEDVIGKMDDELLICKEMANSFMKQDKQVLSKKKTMIYENTFVDKDENEVNLETIKVPFYNEEGKIDGIIAISRDITIRKNAEEKIKESEERFRQLAESIDEVFWLRTDDKMLYISPGYERIWGRSCDSVYIDVKNFYEYIFEEDKQRILEVLDKEEYKIHGYFNEKYRIEKPDGTLRWVWARSFPVFNDKGKIIRWAGIAEDITTLKIAEEVVARTREEMIRVELQKKSMKLEQLEELDRLRTDFFANLSHELRTPINLIFASLKMIELEEESYSGVNNLSKSNKYINIIKQNSYRLMRLINNLIDVTRLDAGFLSLTTTNWDIIDMIKNVTLSVATYAKNKKIDLDFQTEIEHLTIECDPDKIERIMLNLLSNAIKFNSEGGKVNVSIKVNNSDVFILVRDNGIGIPEDKLEMIFERFKQVDSRLNKEGEGSGIGLSLVKSLVEMHGGTISINSALGIGTDFVIKLPNKITHHKKDTIIDFENDERDSSRIERIRMEFSDIYGLKF